MFINYDLINSNDFWINLVVWICSSILIIAVILDFIFFEEKIDTKNKKKSKVATWTMALFFFLLYIVWILKIWNLSFWEKLDLILIFFWIFLVIVWTIFNVVWRYYLSSNWANHIKIYKDHFLVKTGPYKIVRHPLYASLIWFWIWVSIVYLNYMMLTLVIFIFIPMMYYRARQEEKLLNKNFLEYKNYKKNTWMFFPKLF